MPAPDKSPPSPPLPPPSLLQSETVDRASRRTFLRGIAGAAAMATVGTTAGVVDAAGVASQAVADKPPPLPYLAATAEIDWKLIPKQFLLDPEIAYLNTGSLGACPRIVVKDHARWLEQIEANPAHLLYGAMGREMETVRARAAEFLGVGKDEVMLSANTTSGMNLIAGALPLQAGDEVLLSNHEHPGGRICWEYEREKRGIVIREFDLNGVTDELALLDTVKAGITTRTRVLSVSHVSTVNGLKMPVSALSQLTRPSGIALVVDGAQSAGMLAINLREMGCDAFATSGHKWMLGPKGTGVLYLSRELQPRLSSVYLKSGLAAYTAASGTRNTPQILAQGRALDFLDAIGQQRIEARVLSLADELRKRLATIAGIEIASPAQPQLRSAIVSLKINSAHPRHAGGAVSQLLLEKYRIVVKPVPGEYLQGRGLRISTHFYNSAQDIERLADALEKITAGI